MNRFQKAFGYFHPLYLIRNDRLLTQEQLAKQSKVSQRTINSIERGVGRPNYQTRRRLLTFLGIEFKSHQAIFEHQRKGENT